jgi:transposase InsO family protein
MPWQTTSMNDVRREFVLKALQQGRDFARLCREYGISRKTGYKWKQRALDDGLDALAERSRRPKHSPKQLDEDTLCALIRLKLRHPHWGAKKLALVFARSGARPPSLSTYQRILTKAGLVAKRRLRRRSPAVRVQSLVAAREPNDVWTIDFKGWWLLRSGQRCEPLTVRDAFSRYVLAVRLPANATTAAVKAEFERLFELYGLPKVIKSDNGSPFASSHSVLGLTRLSAWWVQLGIELDRSRPAHPQDNAAHERFHGDIEREIASCVQADRDAQQAACDLWRDEFNHLRPHESLGGRCPAELYRKSPRVLPNGPLHLDYGAGFFCRKISAKGVLFYRQHRIFVSQALAGCHVGLRRAQAGNFELWLNYLLLGSIDFETDSFLGSPSLPKEAARLSA